MFAAHGIPRWGSDVIRDFLTRHRDAMKSPNDSFKVCRAAMRNNKIDQSQLAKGVQIVPDAIFEIISKQHDGWGYIKVGH